tara:strand:+ start:627 stop:815 length:189 start_codon:yes stop_codon:yes gene_type:complete
MNEEYELLKETLKSNLRMMEIFDKHNVPNKEKMVLNILIELRKVIDIAIKYMNKDEDDNYLA